MKEVPTGELALLTVKPFCEKQLVGKYQLEDISGKASLRDERSNYNILNSNFNQRIFLKIDNKVQSVPWGSSGQR